MSKMSSEISDYQVVRNYVRFNCVGCREVINTELADAGKPDHCPVCGVGFKSPGIKEDRDRLARELDRLKVKDERKKTPRPSRNQWLAFTSAVIGLVGFVVLMCLLDSGSTKRARLEVQEPIADTPEMALQRILDRVDSKLGSDIFGKVTAKGSVAVIRVNADYFTRITPETRTLVLTSTLEAWPGDIVELRTEDGTLQARRMKDGEEYRSILSGSF